MKKILILIGIIFIGFLAIAGWWNYQLSPVNSNDKITQDVVIAKGKSVSEIGQKLESLGLIRSAWVFTFYIKQKGWADKIQAGTFKISPSMSVSEVAETLKGGAVDIWVTLLEGWRVEEMAEELNSKFNPPTGGLNSKFLELAKEGYMFPDTYLFPKDATAEQIAEALRNNFDKKYSADLRAKIKAQGLTEDEGVILASIVEREARSDEARKMVASILLKRWKIDMGLNTDATIQYALVPQGSKKAPVSGWWKKSLTMEDLKIKSAYNTYLHAGLPPTPICNPSLSSLKAVAGADSSTPYLYYYHDSKGVSHYGKTLDEHNANVAKYP